MIRGVLSRALAAAELAAIAALSMKVGQAVKEKLDAALDKKAG